MIITRSPLRLSLGGGGTDLPSYYQKYEGFVLSAAIDRYVYITLHSTFVPELILKYSKMERVASATQVEHPIVREAMRLLEIPGQGLEIISMADIPAGTGLGSSGSFTVSLLKSLHTLKRDLIHPQELAEQACRIEIELLKEPVGKQDQYIASYGGLMCFDFLKNGQVKARPLRLNPETLQDLEENLLVFFTGFTRPTVDVLREQDDKSRKDDKEMIENLHIIKNLGLKTRDSLEAGDISSFVEHMNIHWEHKKKRSKIMTNPKIDDWHKLALGNGARGGKLIGAGGGGFLLFYADDKRRLRKVLREAGLPEMRFRFDFEGAKTIIS